MPNRNKTYDRSKGVSHTLQRNLLIVIAIVVVIVVVVAVAASTSAPQSDVAFPARILGTATAPVVLEEFADYQCADCALFNSVAETRLREQYINPGKVVFIFRNIPILGGESQSAALAALCAGDQGMFWEYHDLLFKYQAGQNKNVYTVANLDAMASQLFLNGSKFNQCLNNQSHANIISGDISRANYFGVKTAPAFYLNGGAVNIVSPDFRELFAAIDTALKS